MRVKGGISTIAWTILVFLVAVGVLIFIYGRINVQQDAIALWQRGVDQNIPDKTAGSIKVGLNRLKEIGFTPTTVLDVGANVGDWARVIKEVYPTAQVLMLEGSPSCTEALLTTGNHFAISLVGRRNMRIDFYENPGGQGTGNSIYREKTKYFSAVRPQQRRMYTIDTLMNGQPEVQFLKLDIQGAERDALIGARRVLRSVQVILLEISLVNYNEGAPLALDTLAYLDEIGFDILDIPDFNILKGRGKDSVNILGQMDMLLVRRGSALFARRKEMIDAAAAET